MIVNFMNFSNADTLKIKTNNFLDDSTNPVQKTDFFFPSEIFLLILQLQAGQLVSCVLVDDVILHVPSVLELVRAGRALGAQVVLPEVLQHTRLNHLLEAELARH